jgi:hypothetical protein
VANAQAFRVQRLTLGAGVFTAIRPPAVFAAVSIGNGTAADLQVHTNEDQTEYLIIAPDFERSVPVDILGAFASPEIAFWLKSVPGGTVVLLWTT